MDGPIRIALDPGRAGLAEVHNPRSESIIARLAGWSHAQAARSLRSLLPICGAAHTVALLAAIEGALDVEIDPAQQAARRAVVEVECLLSVAWRVLVDWAMLLDGEPLSGPLRDIRRTGAALEHAIFGTAAWAVAGGIGLAPDVAAAARASGDLEEMLHGLCPPEMQTQAAASPESLAGASGCAIPARMVALSLQDEAVRARTHRLPLFSGADAAWFAARLTSDSDFSRAPTLDGTPAEVGALASARHIALLSQARAEGASTPLRLAAQTCDLGAFQDRLKAALVHLGRSGPTSIDCDREGRGAAVVETARGPLAYIVCVAGGRLERVANIAPTEWNFHPQGPCVTSLLAAGAPLDSRSASLIALGFDPCVPVVTGLATTRPTPPPPAGFDHA